MNQQQMMKIRKMQKAMMEAQEQLEKTVFKGTAGGGIVSVSIKGDHQVVEVKIDKDAFESQDDIEMIEDSIVAAFNDANKKMEEESQRVMGPFASLGGGMF